MQIPTGSQFVQKSSGPVPLPARPTIFSMDQAGDEYFDKQYELDAPVLRQLTQAPQSVFVRANDALSRINSSMSIENSGDESSTSVVPLEVDWSYKLYLDYANRLLSKLDDMSTVLDLSSEEAEELKFFAREISHLPEYIYTLYAEEHADTTEYLLRSAVVQSIDYFERVHEWLEESGIYERYKIVKEKEKKLEDEIQEAIDPMPASESDAESAVFFQKDDKESEPYEDISDGLKAHSSGEVRTLRVHEFPPDSAFIGKVDKEENEGNGLYITSFRTPINAKGDQSYVVPEGRAVELKSFNEFSELGERQSGQIDIEIPINIASLNDDGYVVLPTHLGYRATAIGLVDESGNQVDSSNVRTEQDEFGVTVLRNLPPETKSVKYRLEKTELASVTSNERWLDTFGDSHVVNKFLDKCIEEAKEKRDFKLVADLTKTKLRSKLPVYTKDTNIQRMLREAPDFYAVQQIVGYIGHCEHMSLCRVNDLRKEGVPALIASGLTVGKNDGSFSFVSNCGHAAVVYLDENGIPIFDEATDINSDDHLLNEEKVKDDTPKVLRLYKSDNSGVMENGLTRLSATWKKRKPKPQASGDDTIERVKDYSAMISSGTSYSPISKDEDEKRRLEDAQRQVAYEHAAKLDDATTTFIEMLQNGNLINIFKCAALIDFFANSRYSKIKEQVAEKRRQGYLELPLIRLLNSIHMEKYETEVEAYLKERLEKGNGETHRDIAREFIEFIFHSAPEIVSHFRNGSIVKSFLSVIDIDEVLFLETEDLLLFRKFLSQTRNEQLEAYPYLLKVEQELKARQGRGELGIKSLELKPRIVPSVIQFNSPEVIASHVELLRMHGDEATVATMLEDHIMERLDNSPEELQVFLELLYRSEVLSDYLELVGGQIALTPHMQKAVADRCKKGIVKTSIVEESQYYGERRSFIKEHIVDDVYLKQKTLYTRSKGSTDPEYRYHWSFYSDMPLILANLEMIGVDLKETMSKDEVIGIVQRDGTCIIGFESRAGMNPALYSSDGSCRLERPASLLDAGCITEDETHPYSHDRQRGRSIAYFLDYFGIDVNELELKDIPDEVIFDKTKDSLQYKAYQFLPYVPLVMFERLLACDEVLARGVKEMGLSPIQDENTEMLQSLFDKYPEAEEIVFERITNNPQCIYHVISALTSNTTRYKYSVLVDMLHRYGEGDKLNTLKEKLSTSFAEGQDCDEDEFIGKLKTAFKETYRSSGHWAEIRNELHSLSNQELRILSYVLKEFTSKSNQLGMLIGQGTYLHRKEGRTLKNPVNVDVQYMIEEFVENDVKAVKTIPPDVTVAKNRLSMPKNLNYIKAMHLKDLPKVSLIAMGLKNQGVRLLGQVLAQRDSTFWLGMLCQMIERDSKGTRLEFLSEGSPLFREACDVSDFSSLLTDKNQQSFLKNGNVQFITRSGPSKMYGTSPKGEFNTVREVQDGDPVELINHTLSARMGKLMVNQYKDTSDPNPYHYVVDLEWLGNGATDEALSENLKKLIALLVRGVSRKQQQHLHIYYRGKVVLSFAPDQLRAMLSAKVIEDNYGERPMRTDFILQLNYLAHNAAKVSEAEEDSGYKPGAFPVSNTEWVPRTREGTAIILTDNVDSIVPSMPLFLRWIQRHIDVRRLVI